MRLTLPFRPSITVGSGKSKIRLRIWGGDAAGDLDNVGSFNCVNWEIGKGGDNFLELGGFSRSRPDLPAGALRAATGAMDFERENRVGLREIPRSRDARSVRLAETLSPWHVWPSWKSGLRSNCIRDRAIFPGRAIRR